VRLYNQFSPGGLHATEMDFARWKQHWQVQPAADKPACCAVLDALHSVIKLGTYPIMCLLLRIMATLRVTITLKYIQDLPATDNAWGRATERTNADVHNQDIGYG
jgi:hypothetical protein